MPHGRSGFTLIELISVIIVLALLSAAAIPMYVDHVDRTRVAANVGVIGAARSGLALVRAGYVLGATGLPPDADANGAPDHLGDLVPTELTLLDALLEPPLPRAPQGWKGYGNAPFPVDGRYYVYFDDADGDEHVDWPDEAFLIYDARLGTLTAHVPPYRPGLAPATSPLEGILP